jgi:hypothetical protein
MVIVIPVQRLAYPTINTLNAEQRRNAPLPSPKIAADCATSRDTVNSYQWMPRHLPHLRPQEPALAQHQQP